MRGWDAFTTERLATLTGRHPSTVRRWLRTQRIPPWVMRLLEIASDLGELERAWSGWALRAGTLVSPEGWQFKPSEVRCIPFMHAQIAAYQQLQRTHLQADWIEERYVESEARPRRSTCQECDTYRAIGREVSPPAGASSRNARAACP